MSEYKPGDWIRVKQSFTFNGFEHYGKVYKITNASLGGVIEIAVPAGTGNNSNTMRDTLFIHTKYIEPFYLEKIKSPEDLEDAIKIISL